MYICIVLRVTCILYKVKNVKVNQCCHQLRSVRLYHVNP
jgi:hypothetical protein